MHVEINIMHHSHILLYRFEAVDRDLHPPLGGSTIPPQPLRPAPQPRPTARPRPSPLQTPSTINYLRMQEAGPGPLTPPPSLQRGSIRSRAPGPSVFLFQSEPPKNHGLFQSSIERSAFDTVFDDDPVKTVASTESIQMTPYVGQNHVDSRSVRYIRRSFLEKCLNREYTKLLVLFGRLADLQAFVCLLRRQFEPPVKDSVRLKYGISPSVDNRHDGLEENEDISRSYGNYDIVQRNHVARTYARNESRNLPVSYNATNSANVASQMIMESIYGPQTVSKMLQNSEELNGDLNRKSDDLQIIEMIPFKTSTSHQQEMDLYAFHGGLSKAQDLQRVSQYIQSLPDLPVYESMNELQAHPSRESILFTSAIQEDETKVSGLESASSPVPPPPAPPDPPQEIAKKSSPTTGERIFSALRSVTSQSYIDASEFYK